MPFHNEFVIILLRNIKQPIMVAGTFFSIDTQQRINI